MLDLLELQEKTAAMYNETDQFNFLKLRSIGSFQNVTLVFIAFQAHY